MLILFKRKLPIKYLILGILFDQMNKTKQKTHTHHGYFEGKYLTLHFSI